MDGNGRWAAMRGLPRLEGHRRGVEAVRRTVKEAHDRKIEYLTLFSFSTENWRRPASEISDLLGLLKRYIRNDLADLHAQNTKIQIIGARDALTDDLKSLIFEAEELTKHNYGLTLVVAFNYGARQEIARAAQKLAEDARNGLLDPALITPEFFEKSLDTKDIPDPDLVIRTSGEQRISNFLLWQAAYAEFVFIPTFWPDFDANAFGQALDEYQNRDRRFGGLSQAV